MFSSERLFQIIDSTVTSIELQLKEANNTGIYFAPELHIAFCIGMAISKSQIEIFGGKATWLRETDLGTGGPSDIIFKQDQATTVIELKLRDKHDAYKADIEKLKRLGPGNRKFFCVLLDSFTNQNDERLLKLEKEYGDQLSQVGHSSFPTWNDWYKTRVYCNLNLYEVA